VAPPLIGASHVGAEQDEPRTQLFPHLVYPTPQSKSQVPFTHFGVAPGCAGLHTVPQLPQLWIDVARFVHAPGAHGVLGGSHVAAQPEGVHTSVEPQPTPHAPQLVFVTRDVSHPFDWEPSQLAQPGWHAEIVGAAFEQATTAWYPARLDLPQLFSRVVGTSVLFALELVRRTGAAIEVVDRKRPAGSGAATGAGCTRRASRARVDTAVRATTRAGLSRRSADRVVTRRVGVSVTRGCGIVRFARTSSSQENDPHPSHLSSLRVGTHRSTTKGAVVEDTFSQMRRECSAHSSRGQHNQVRLLRTRIREESPECHYD
jgi:hypothetical protein